MCISEQYFQSLVEKCVHTEVPHSGCQLTVSMKWSMGLGYMHCAKPWHDKRVIDQSYPCFIDCLKLIILQYET